MLGDELFRNNALAEPVSLWYKYQRLLSPTCSEIVEASASGRVGARLRVQHGGGGVIRLVFLWLLAVRLLSMGPTPPEGEGHEKDILKPN